MITIDTSGLPVIPESILEEARSAYNTVLTDYSNWNGWASLPTVTTETDLSKIKNTAENIRCESQVVIVLGIGGSYLGAAPLLIL